ncbi:myosin-2 heavy chain-like [Saccostrea echinata]|uniref:myosin-2 heavy chain-like n=1 Tax=Saccostrea echinata TaxID=191078 RepID=UPI002A810E64|nr:myosin-2 heavy chain-like [Saccostrea echinata]
MSNKLEQVSTKLNKLDHIEKRLNELERNAVNVNTELKEMKVKVNGVEECVTHISKQYDDQTREVKEMKKSVSNIRNENEVILNELEIVRNKFEDLNERHLDLQTRSMRDNLIFSGIPETQDENTEEVLKEFISSEMNITEAPQFHRVHRIGKRLTDKHRPTVAKFVLHKEREKIRKAAPSTLEGKAFGVNEQFPKEINERRKVLYPHYKKAKKNLERRL